jgi:hypothetical protein
MYDARAPSRMARNHKHQAVSRAARGLRRQHRTHSMCGCLDRCACLRQSSADPNKSSVRTLSAWGEALIRLAWRQPTRAGCACSVPLHLPLPALPCAAKQAAWRPCDCPGSGSWRQVPGAPRRRKRCEVLRAATAALRLRLRRHCRRGLKPSQHVHAAGHSARDAGAAGRGDDASASRAPGARAGCGRPEGPGAPLGSAELPWCWPCGCNECSAAAPAAATAGDDMSAGSGPGEAPCALLGSIGLPRCWP